MILFADWSCPFAHRALALLEHLQCPYELRESEVGAAPQGLDAQGSVRVLPSLLVDGMVITESRVMLEHLAEQHGLLDAYPAALRTRTLHRQAMAAMDTFLAPRLFVPTDASVDGPRLDSALGALGEATATVPVRPHLLALHLAPVWLRFRVWHPAHVITRAIEARRELRAWLDDALQLDCVARTSPDPVQHQRELVRIRQAGLLPML